MTSLFGIINLLPGIVILIAAIQLIPKSQVEGILILIGALTSLISTAFYSFIFPIITSDSGDHMYYITIVSTVSGLGHICLAIGLLLLVQKFIKGR